MKAGQYYTQDGKHYVTLGRSVNSGLSARDMYAFGPEGFTRSHHGGVHAQRFDCDHAPRCQAVAQVPCAPPAFPDGTRTAYAVENGALVYRLPLKGDIVLQQDASDWYALRTYADWAGGIPSVGDHMHQDWKRHILEPIEPEKATEPINADVYRDIKELRAAAGRVLNDWRAYNKSAPGLGWRVIKWSSLERLAELIGERPASMIQPPAKPPEPPVPHPAETLLAEWLHWSDLTLITPITGIAPKLAQRTRAFFESKMPTPPIAPSREPHGRRRADWLEHTRNDIYLDGTYISTSTNLPLRDLRSGNDRRADQGARRKAHRWAAGRSEALVAWRAGYRAAHSEQEAR